MENTKTLIAQVNLLLKDIREIIGRNIPYPEKSDLIGERLRRERIYLDKETIRQYRDNNDYVTIDPKLCRSLNNNDCEILNANSFGPFNPKDYFMKDFRILWILKEDYIKSQSWDDIETPDRGGHNKAEEYGDYEDAQYIITYKTVIKTVKEILQRKFQRPVDENEAMKHICIIELNHFPGLNFKTYKSKDSFLEQWAVINHELNSALINFYNPSLVVVNSGIMGSFLEICDRYGNLVPPYPYHDIFNYLRQNNSIKHYNESYCSEYTLTIAGRKLIKTEESHSKRFLEGTGDNGIASALYDMNSCAWVGLNYHPIRGLMENENQYNRKWEGFAKAAFEFSEARND